jgi:hypothetical protein
MKTHNVPLLSAKEKMPFEITPFMLHLTRENGVRLNGPESQAQPPHAQSPNGGQPGVADRAPQGQPASQ